MISQLDLTIFDIEIEHHMVRVHLDLGMGNASYVESASLRHVARAASSYHARASQPFNVDVPKMRGTVHISLANMASTSS